MRMINMKRVFSISYYAQKWKAIKKYVATQYNIAFH